MKLFRKMLDRLEPAFKKGGRLERYYSVYEAIDTFLYTPGQVTQHASHVRDSLDMKRMMSLVVVALIPCIYMAFHNTGYQANLAISEYGATPPGGWREDVMQSLGLEHDPQSLSSNIVYGGLWFLPLYLITMVVGGTFEAIFAMVRKHEINEGFLVTGMLYPLTLPPTLPLWQAGLGIAFGVVIGKEVFGGTGKNFLNPALTARAFVYFAFAGDMTGDNIWTAIDGFTAATPLTGMASAAVSTTPVEATTYHYNFWDCFWGWIPGSMGETSVFACLLGAALLIATGIGSWRIMLAVVIGAVATAIPFYVFRNPAGYPLMYMPPWWHLCVGGFAFGTVFMATDPVSAAVTNAGKWMYGILIGVMTILIRVINPAYPEGIMLAILFGNVVAPLMDFYVIQANVKRRAARYAS